MEITNNVHIGKKRKGPVTYQPNFVFSGDPSSAYEFKLIIIINSWVH